MTLFNKNYLAAFVVKILQVSLIFILLACSQYYFSSIYFLESDFVIVSNSILTLNENINFLSTLDSINVHKNQFSADANENILLFLLYSTVNITFMAYKILPGPLGLYYELLLCFLYYLDVNCDTAETIRKPSKKFMDCQTGLYTDRETLIRENAANYLKKEDLASNFFIDVDSALKILEQKIYILSCSKNLLVNKIEVLSSYYDFCVLFS